MTLGIRQNGVGSETPAEIGELLMEWINKSSPYQYEHIFDDHEEGLLWEDHPDYWSVLLNLLSRGLVDPAIELLECHSKHTKSDDGEILFSNYDDNPYVLVGELLKSMPRFYRGHKRSRPDWTNWHSRCEAYYEDLLAYPDLRDVVKLLSGEMEPISDYPWYRQAIAFVFYNKPWMDALEVSQEATNHYVQEQKNKERTGAGGHIFDEIFLYCMTQGHMHLILEIDSLFPSLFVPCHLIDLLIHTRAVEIPSKDDMESLWPDSVGIDFELETIREHFILEYAQSLKMGNQSSWLIPIGYMRSCPRAGPFCVIEALKREDPSISASKVTKMLHICKLVETAGKNRPAIERGVADVRSLIHRVIGRSKFENGNYGAALHHYSLSGKTKDLVQVSNHLTTTYYHSSLAHPSSGLQPIESVLEAFGCHPQFPPQLELLAKYRELVRSFNQKNYEVSCRVAVDVLSFSTHPLSIWIPVIEDFLVPLLTNNQKRAWIDTRGTYVIMEKLEALGRRVDLVKEKGESKGYALPLMVSDQEVIKFEAKLPQIREYLIQNLKKAILDGDLCLLEPAESGGFGSQFGGNL